MHEHARGDRKGRALQVPSTRAQLLLSLQSQTREKGLGRGVAEDGWREVRSNGERDLSSGEADEGRGRREGSAAHMLPFTVLVCSVNPGFCCFPQSAGAQTPSQEARQSLP